MNQLPRITKGIIIANTLVLLFDYILKQTGVYLTGLFGLYSWQTNNFHVWQLFTYMFMHGNFWHLFTNMFAVLMFAPELERRWGEQRFSIYYLVCGIGAGLVQELVWMLTATGAHTVTVGASGAVFGILFAFGWLFPEVKMFLLFIPIPISSRIFVTLYALFELWQGVAPTAGDNVAHFAHLGGMLFGWLIILWWKHKGVSGVEAGHYDSQLKYKSQRLWRNIKSWFHDTFTKIAPKKEKNTFDGYHYQDPINYTQSSSSNYTQPDADEEEINRILDKIKLHGYSSLTEDEKQRLFRK